MGSGNVKGKQLMKIEYKEEESFDSIENNDKIQAVMFCQNEELEKYEDLLVQACFCDVPKVSDSIYNYEKEIMSKGFS